MSDSIPPPPPPPVQAPAPAPLGRKPAWAKWWVPVVVIGGLFVIGLLIRDDERGGGVPGGCDEPSAAWVETLQAGFFRQYRDASIGETAYVEAETSEGTAYYVALDVAGLDRVAVFGTSEAPLQADPGLIAAANTSARELSNFGTAAAPGSPADELLRDVDATYRAEQCLS